MTDSRTWPALDVSGIMRAGTSATDEPAGAAERLHAALAQFDITAIDERSPDLWRIFFRDAVQRDRATAALRFEHPDLAAEPVDVPDEDWAARSQADLRAVRVGSLVIAPPWDVYPDERVIVIQPSMGFGTGHHATTRLCLAALQRFDLRGRSVIDVGCGSGVLAIAASLLGGSDVIGFDEDPDAIHAARENLLLNPQAHVDLTVGHLGALHLVPSDLVLANLTGALLVSAATALQRLVSPEGSLILSGFLTHEEAMVREAFSLAVDYRAEEDGWACLTLRAS